MQWLSKPSLSDRQRRGKTVEAIKAAQEFGSDERSYQAAVVAREKGRIVLQAKQIALIDGKPVYKDCDGKLCIETSCFMHLRGLTPSESKKLSEVLERIKVKEAQPILVEEKGGDRKEGHYNKSTNTFHRAN